MSELNIIKEEIETLNEKLAEKMARNQEFMDSLRSDFIAEVAVFFLRKILIPLHLCGI